MCDEVIIVGQRRCDGYTSKYSSYLCTGWRRLGMMLVSGSACPVTCRNTLTVVAGWCWLVLAVYGCAADLVRTSCGPGRSGYSSPSRGLLCSATTTLNTYGHLWPDRDESTRAAVEAVFQARLGCAADSRRTTG